MEVELLRFRMSLAQLRRSPTPEALDEMYERFDILWSRVFMMGHGQVGESLRRYDAEHGSVAAIADYLSEIDPAARPLHLDAPRRSTGSSRGSRTSRHELREYTLRVVRADGAASERVRERIQSSARTTALISVAAVLISVLSLFLILRENRRQRDLVRVMPAQRRAGRAGEPGQVALPHHDEPRAAQSAERHPRAAGAARAGRPRRAPAAAGGAGAELRALDAADAERACSTTARSRTGASSSADEPFRVSGLADAVQSRCAPRAPGGAQVEVAAGTPERVYGDLDRLRQVFLHLARLHARGPRPGRDADPLHPLRAASSSARSPFPEATARSTGASTC